MRWQLVESAAAPVRPTGLRPALDQGIHGSVWHMAFLRSGGYVQRVLAAGHSGGVTVGLRRTAFAWCRVSISGRDVRRTRHGTRRWRRSSCRRPRSAHPPALTATITSSRRRTPPETSPRKMRTRPSASWARVAPRLRDVVGAAPRDDRAQPADPFVEEGCADG
jgi:hypothetical protein